MIFPAELIASPVGSPVAVQVYGAVPPLADNCRLAAVPTLPVCEPGLVTAGLPGGGVVPPAAKAATPFGVPRPVGPSQPVPALHCWLAEQLPLLPAVTSFRSPRSA